MVGRQSPVLYNWGLIHLTLKSHMSKIVDKLISCNWWSLQNLKCSDSQNVDCLSVHVPPNTKLCCSFRSNDNIFYLFSLFKTHKTRSTYIMKFTTRTTLREIKILE